MAPFPVLCSEQRCEIERKGVVQAPRLVGVVDPTKSADADGQMPIEKTFSAGRTIVCGTLRSFVW